MKINKLMSSIVIVNFRFHFPSFKRLVDLMEPRDPALQRSRRTLSLKCSRRSKSSLQASSWGSFPSWLKSGGARKPWNANSKVKLVRIILVLGLERNKVTYSINHLLSGVDWGCGIIGDWHATRCQTVGDAHPSRPCFLPRVTLSNERRVGGEIVFSPSQTWLHHTKRLC